MSTEEKGALTFSFPFENIDQRLRELILYVSDKCSQDSTFGAVKLNKILYFSDFFSFQQFGEPITGAEYMRLGRGPAPRRMLPVRAQMEVAGELVIQEGEYFGYPQQRPIPLRKADVGLFTARDIALVDDVIQALWNRAASEVSVLSHDIAWRAARDKESIPYEAAFLSDAPLDQSDIDRAKELIAQHGWRV